ncbi:site-specific integrase [Spirosoma harenae]
MKYTQNRRLSKLASVREIRKVKQIRVPHLAVTFIARIKPNGRDIAIYCRLTYNSKRSQFSTDITCKRKDFDTKTQVIQGQPEQTALLATIKANALKASAQLRTFGQPIDLEVIRKLTLGDTLHKEETPNLLKAFALFLERSQKECKSGDIDFDTYKQHERWAKRVGEFFTEQYGKNCALYDVKPSDAKDLQLSLKLESSHGQNYSLKIVQFTKRIFNYAVENLWIERNPFMNFKGNRKPSKIEYLNEKEISLLVETNKLNPSLRRVLDVFLFQIFTGFAWKDVEQLRDSDIGTHEETGVRFIEKPRQKSGTSQIVPLLPQAERLLKRYAIDPICKSNGRLLPVPANATMNNYLKEIAAVVGIQKRLTTHMARRTFITLFFHRGMSLKSVSVMAGHTNTAVTERHYLRVTPGKIIQEMQVVFPEMKKADNNQNEQAA